MFEGSYIKLLPESVQKEFRSWIEKAPEIIHKSEIHWLDRSIEEDHIINKRIDMRNREAIKRLSTEVIEEMASAQATNYHISKSIYSLLLEELLSRK